MKKEKKHPINERLKRKRRTKAEMAAARAEAEAAKRQVVEAVYTPEGVHTWPIAVCPKCFSLPSQEGRSGKEREIKLGGKTYNVYTRVHPCSNPNCRTDLIGLVSKTLEQRDILPLLLARTFPKKQLEEYQQRRMTATILRQRRTGQPTTESRGAVAKAPVEAAKKKAVKRKR